ncbi:MAG: hypothetical protein HQL94_11720, partial [Magnetococcales bacterium]|nr:hypothetical protein [Magnetococcales bacterium]
FGYTNAIAGTDHSHGPVTKDVVNDKAKNAVSGLVNKKVLEQSWTQSTISSTVETIRKGDPVWKVTFTNTKETDPAKKNLYVFMTQTGGFLDANVKE